METMEKPESVADVPTERPAPVKQSGGWRRWTILSAIVIGLGYWGASIRHPADFSKPLTVRGNVPFKMASNETLHVGTFNIHGCKGRDRQRDIMRVAHCIGELDIVGLNEVRGDYRTNQARSLGKILKRGSLFAPTERRWFRDDFGNGLLTKVELGTVNRVPLTNLRLSYRNVVLTNFQFGGETVQLMVAHIECGKDRGQQMRAVREVFLALREPAILMGDLNVSAREDEELRKLLAVPGVHDVLNDVASRTAKNRIVDWIIVRGFQTIAAKSSLNDASDHPIVTAELRLEKSSDVAAASSETIIRK